MADWEPGFDGLNRVHGTFMITTTAVPEHGLRCARQLPSPLSEVTIR